MNAGHKQRCGKDGENLGVDAPANLLFGHAHLLQNLKACRILVALGDLLVVHDKHRAEEKDQTQQCAKIQHTAKEGVKTGACLLPAADAVGEAIYRFSTFG